MDGDHADFPWSRVAGCLDPWRFTDRELPRARGFLCTTTDNFFSAFEQEQSASEVAQRLEPGGPYRHVLEYWERSSGEQLQRLLYTDIKTYLVELLMKSE